MLPNRTRDTNTPSVLPQPSPWRRVNPRSSRFSPLAIVIVRILYVPFRAYISLTPIKCLKLSVTSSGGPLLPGIFQNYYEFTEVKVRSFKVACYLVVHCYCTSTFYLYKQQR